jgi:hypothetical protein
MSEGSTIHCDNLQHNLIYYPRIFLDGLRKTTANLSAVDIPAEYRLETIPTEPNCSVQRSDDVERPACVSKTLAAKRTA